MKSSTGPASDFVMVSSAGANAVKKEKSGRVISNYPILSKTDGAGNRNPNVIVNAANAQWVFCLVLRAIRRFVIERAQSFCSMAICFWIKITCRKAKYFCQRLSGHVELLICCDFTLSIPHPGDIPAK